MNLIGPSLLLCLVLGSDGPPAPKLPLGKDTTYVTGPLDKDGYIDYEAALNDRLGAGVAPEKNANVLLWEVLGLMPEGFNRMPAEFFKAPRHRRTAEGRGLLHPAWPLRDGPTQAWSERIRRGLRSTESGRRAAVGGEGLSAHRRVAGGQRKASGPCRGGHQTTGLLQPTRFAADGEEALFIGERIAPRRAEMPGTGSGPDRPCHASGRRGQVRRRLAGSAGLPSARPPHSPRRYANRNTGGRRHRHTRKQCGCGLCCKRGPDCPEDRGSSEGTATPAARCRR